VQHRNAVNLNDRRLHARLVKNEGSLETLSKEQKPLLEDVRNRVDENTRQIRTGNAIGIKFFEAFRLDWIRTLLEEIKTEIRNSFATNLATYTAIMDIRGRLPSQLERSLCQEPFILEDSIGRLAPVHMQFINSWEAFDSVLELRFLDMQGFQIVRNRRYVIQAKATGREINRSRP